LTGSSIYPSLPIATVAVLSLFSGAGWAFDTSASAWSQLTLVPGTYILTPTSGRVGSAVPWTWAVNDLIRLSLTYEVA